ncbi:hypothetical protein L873DRAFT_1814902 [Choiromyces venosus 120613-1]|uniref:Uncharacterized protein n=1 Tax=Choiromyces venosus 120613-1 TaxID=1336337 RepID=A0A3N4JJY8_9PEZI|nr:hypothetical protein L873DRAFT_1814902 [Choiromyces venosus 120613-1]
MPWDQATGKRRGTTINERVRIIELRTAGMSFRRIRAETGISHTQVAENLSTLDIGHWTLAILLTWPQSDRECLDLYSKVNYNL